MATGKIRSSWKDWPITKSVQEVFLTMLWDVGESAHVKSALVGINKSCIGQERSLSGGVAPIISLMTGLKSSLDMLSISNLDSREATERQCRRYGVSSKRVGLGG